MTIQHGERHEASATTRLERELSTSPGAAVDMAAATVRLERSRRRMARRVADEKQWGEIRNG